MKNVYIYSYNSGSNGASELASALNISRIRHHGSKWRGNSYKKVINWGCASWDQMPKPVNYQVINRPELVAVASNKLAFFRAMTDAAKGSSHARNPPRTVPWTVKHSEAEQWLKEKTTVVVRNSLTGHSGHGIVIVEPGGFLPNAPLYTKYIPKQYEFRVHIMRGNIIDAQRKIRDPDREPNNWKVRSHDNGFIFVRNGFTLPEDVSRQAIAAFLGTGLDFGAVDVVYDHKTSRAYVLEINTAPGLEGATIESYANGFRKILGG